MKIERSQFLSLNELQNQYLNKQPVRQEILEGSGGSSFEEVWKEKTRQLEEGLRFSKHAKSRLADRSIVLSDSQLDRLTQGARKAGEKGIKESLVMVDQLAFIVNVPNNTVITAMEQSRTDETVFTNIDGAVIV